VTGGQWIAISWVSFIMLILTWGAAWSSLNLTVACLITWPALIYLIVRKKRH
jgi:hypothetical protein